MKTLSAALAIAAASASRFAATLNSTDTHWREWDYLRPGTGANHRANRKDKAKRKAQRKARRINRRKP